MPRTFILGTRQTSSLSTSTTVFLQLANTISAGDATESKRQITYRIAGVASGLYARTITNTITAASTVTFRIGGVDKTQTISIPSSTSGIFTDTTHTDAIAAGNQVSIKIVTGSTGTSITYGSFGALFKPTDETQTITESLVDGFPVLSDVSTTIFAPLSGNSSNITTEANTQFKFKQSFTLQDLYAHVSGNTRTTTTTVGTRIGGVNGNLIISVTTLSTGVFEDTTHSDAIVSGNLANFYVTEGSDSAKAFTLDGLGVVILNSANYFHLITGAGVGSSVSKSVTTNFEICGHAGVNTTESQTQEQAQNAFVASNLECFLSANTVTASSTLKFRKNGANGNQTISITASTSGYFEDTTHTDTVITTDLINYQVITGGTGTSLTINSIGILGLITVTNQTILGQSRIQESVNQTILGKSRIQEIVNKTILGKSRIQEKVNQTITGVSRIREVVNQTIVGKSRIQETTVRTVTGQARITQTATQTILGKSRIQEIVHQTIAGIARITTTVSKTIQGLARITETTTQTILGKSRIQETTLQNVQGKSRLTATTTQGVDGIARIQKSITQTIQGISRLTARVTKTIQGKSAVTATTIQNILGKSAIRKTMTKNVDGVSRIQLIEVEDISGKASIAELTIRTVTGLADIRATTTRNIVGKASIIKPKYTIDDYPSPYAPDTMQTISPDVPYTSDTDMNQVGSVDDVQFTDFN